MVFKDLGTAVNQAYDKMKEDISEVVFKEQVAPMMGLAPSSLEEYSKNYKLGNIYGSSSLNPQNRQNRLDKTAIFLYALGFSVADEFQRSVIARIRQRATERNERFEYPPPEDKRISFAQPEQEYLEIEVGKEAPVVKRSRKTDLMNLSLPEKIRYLWDMDAFTGPDSDYPLSGLLKREVTIESCDYNVSNPRIGFVLEVIPPTSDGGIELCEGTYRYSSSGIVGSESDQEVGSLIEFIRSYAGQKVNIVYSRRTSKYAKWAILEMIAPVGADQLLVRNNNIKDTKLVFYPTTGLPQG